MKDCYDMLSKCIIWIHNPFHNPICSSKDGKTFLTVYPVSKQFYEKSTEGIISFFKTRLYFMFDIFF